MRNLIFYGSYYEAIKELPESEQGKVYKAVIDYAMEQKETKLTGIAKAIFVLIKPTLDASIKNYENGKRGGRPTKETEIKTQTETQDITETETQTETQPITQTQRENENDKENDVENDNDCKRKKIKKESTALVGSEPSQREFLTDAEIIEYIKSEIKDEEVCKKFIDFANNRKAMGKKFAMRTKATVDTNINVLRKYAKTIEEAIAILDYSISNNYQGLFAPKNKQTDNRKESPIEQMSRVLGG